MKVRINGNVTYNGFAGPNDQKIAYGNIRYTAMISVPFLPREGDKILLFDDYVRISGVLWEPKKNSRQILEPIIIINEDERLREGDKGMKTLAETETYLREILFLEVAPGNIQLYPDPDK